MKRKILEIILAVFILVIFSSCNSCTSSSAQVAQNNSQDTVYSKSVVKGDTINLILLSDQDTTKKRIIFRKEIKPIEIDTIQANREMIFEQLEQTEMIIQEQQKQIDSMIVVKKKR